MELKEDGGSSEIIIRCTLANALILCLALVLLGVGFGYTWAMKAFQVGLFG